MKNVIVNLDKIKAKYKDQIQKGKKIIAIHEDEDDVEGVIVKILREYGRELEEDEK